MLDSSVQGTIQPQNGRKDAVFTAYAYVTSINNQVVLKIEQLTCQKVYTRFIFSIWDDLCKRCFSLPWCCCAL